jgi:hypothetical protein
MAMPSIVRAQGKRQVKFNGDAPYTASGLSLMPTACRSDSIGMLEGFARPWNVRRPARHRSMTGRRPRLSPMR